MRSHSRNGSRIASHRRPIVSRFRVGVVASRFNGEITQRLVRGALRFFQTQRLAPSQIRVVWVPGALELPVAALHLAKSGRYRAVVALGCILKGETPHYRYLADATLKGLVLAAVLTGVPVTSGVITAQSWALAKERSKLRGLNRGWEAAKASWELAHLLATV